jgi:NADH-quinone oxidoreductase subunit I/NAD(P)H-quinone oxidoreductase subunit I
MNGIKEYFSNIRDAMTTTLAGMKITLRYWIKEPAITVEYPDRLGPGRTLDNLVAPGYRGFLHLDADKCIGCMQCMRACALNCIRIEMGKGPEGRVLNRFAVNQAKCMYCGLCVEECPSGSLSFTRRFEGACYDIADLRREQVMKPTPVAKLKKQESTQ